MTEPSPPPVQYLDLPKNIGSTEPDTLLEIAERHIDLFDDTESPYRRAEHASIVGSALVESMISLDDPTHQHDDYRLTTLDIAAFYLEQAAIAEFEIIEKGAYHSDDQVEWLRATLNALFIPVYKDMVCGEISAITVEETLAQLQKTTTYTEKLLSGTHTPERVKKQLRGFLNELSVLIDMWHDVTEDDAESLIAIPSTHRGGSGRSRAEETHDVVFLRQNSNTTFSVVSQSEIKSRVELRNNPALLGRYKNPIIAVGYNNSSQVTL